MKTWISTFVGITAGCIIFYYTLIYRGMTLELDNKSGNAINENFILNVLLIIVIGLIIGFIIYIIWTMFEKNIYAKWLLSLSVTVILITSFVFGIFTLDSIAYSSQRSYIGTEVLDVVKENNNPKKIDNQIERLMKQSFHISELKLYDIKNVDSNITEYTNKTKPTYQYQREPFAPEWTLVKFDSSGYSNGNWLIQFNYRSYEKISSYILFSGIAISWTLFGIWAIFNVHKQRKLNFGWIIIFIVFNVFGYLFYKYEKVWGNVSKSIKQL